METQNITATQKLSFVKKSDLTEKKLLFKPVDLKETSKKLILKKAEPKIVDTNFVITENLFKYNAIKEIGPKKEMWSPDGVAIQKAYDTICEMWNKDQKSRNFIKHLVSGFLPYNPWSRILNTGEDTLKCAILNHTITGIMDVSKDVAKFSILKMGIDCHASVEGREEYSEDEIKSINEERAKMKPEIREMRVAVGSDTSTKFMQVESVLALRVFAMEIMFQTDELNFTIRKNIINSVQENISDDKKLTKKQVNQVAGQQVYGMDHKIDKSTFSALEKLKVELESQGKTN